MWSHVKVAGNSAVHITEAPRAHTRILRFAFTKTLAAVRTGKWLTLRKRAVYLDNILTREGISQAGFFLTECLASSRVAYRAEP